MNKTLVLAEKPSVGRDIARVLNCGRKNNGYIEGDKYIVTWALGHLVSLADPEVYDERYKTWRIDDLPMLPSNMKLTVIRESGKQFNTVKSLLNRKDVSEVVIATDAGREGELVARWIIEKAHASKPIKRLWISSVTDKAIKEGFGKLRPGREYDNLFASAVARAEADWIVGLNATRALTCKYNAQLSCGRVQTPTLAIIAQREEEIKGFKPRQYYGISAVSGGMKLIWQDERSNSTRTFSKDTCDKIISAARNKDAIVTSLEKVLKKKHAPLLYDLTELQRDANKLFGYSAKETLSIMQRLYESHKLLTYPRTDSRYISSDIVDTLKDRIRGCGVGHYSKAAAKLLRSPIRQSKAFVDDAKVSDHHAIIPTEQSAGFASLSDKERKIYDLVIKRFLAVLSPAFEYEQTTIKTNIGNDVFIAKGKTVISYGWKEIYENNFDEEEDSIDDIREQLLPAINKGDKLKISRLELTSGETKPPAHFNEGSLLSAMENPAKYMSGENKDLIRTIGETGGIGTVATRADIIEKLFNSFLIEKRGKDIFTTSKGRQLLSLVPEELRSPTLTAQWEQKLAQISKGKLSKDAFINDMKSYAKEVVSDIKNSQDQFKHDNLTKNKCPECGKYMLEVSGKKGKMLVCQDRDCGCRKSVSRATNARCPVCHKKLELRGEGDGQIFACSCGHREKLSTFNERKKKEKSGLSKHEVSKYLQKQKKSSEEPMNDALAEALAKLKLNK